MHKQYFQRAFYKVKYNQSKDNPLDSARVG